MITVPTTPNFDDTAEGLILDLEARVEVNHLQNTSFADLTDEVRALQGRILSAKGKVDEVLNEKLANVCRQGICLLAVKAMVGHSHFIRWLKAWKGAPSLRTAERRMGLGANSALVSNLPPGTTINQAYLKLGIIKRPPALGPAQEIRREIRRFEAKLKTLSSKIPLSERHRLAKKIRSHLSKCDRAALKMENSVLRAQLIEQAQFEWACDCILLRL